MFGIQLSTVQKLEMAFVCVMLGIAGLFVFRSVQPTFDTSIAAFTLHRVHPANDNAARNLPVTSTNPRDPKRDETVVVIAVADGKLEITKYPNDPSKKLKMEWKPERRRAGLVYQYYKDPISRVEEFSEGFKQALAYAVYNQVYSRNLGLLRNAAMTQEQVPLEASAREQMNKEIQLINSGVEAGTFEPALLAKVTAAMDAYDGMPGDTTKDKAKEDLARELLNVATKYQNAILAEKDKLIDKYLATMEKLLTSEQKDKFVEGYRSYLQSTRPAGTPNRTRGVTPRSTTVPARGGATTAPARGGTTMPARGGTTMPARGGTTTTPGRGAAGRGRRRGRGDKAERWGGEFVVISWGNGEGAMDEIYGRWYISAGHFWGLFAPRLELP